MVSADVAPFFHNLQAAQMLLERRSNYIACQLEGCEVVLENAEAISDEEEDGDDGDEDSDSEADMDASGDEDEAEDEDEGAQIAKAKAFAAQLKAESKSGVAFHQPLYLLFSSLHCLRYEPKSLSLVQQNASQRMIWMLRWRS